MKVVCTLACRVQSTRLYGKPLQLLDIERKISIIEYMLDHLAATPEIDETVLAISVGEENSPFIRLAERRKLAYVVGDEKDVLARLIVAGEKGKANVVFRVTSECPFIYMAGLPEALARHRASGADLTVIIGMPEGSFFELINLSALQKSHASGEARHRSELCTLYINEHPELFHINKLSAPAGLNRPDIRITVDYPEDLIVVRELYKALKKEGEFITIGEIVDYLDKHPKLNETNNWIEAGKGRIW